MTQTKRENVAEIKASTFLVDWNHTTPNHAIWEESLEIRDCKKPMILSVIVKSFILSLEPEFKKNQRPALKNTSGRED